MTSSKKDNGKKESNKNSKKRDKPDGASWDETALMEMLAQDVRQLLVNRGEKKQSLKGKKAEMVGYLKEHYDVELKDDFDDLTVKELMVELRLRKLDDSSAKKDILIQRLRGEIDAPAPPEKKKRKRGRAAPKDATKKIYVTLYTPAANTEEGATKVLGVFKQKKKAYEKGITQMLEDLEEKYKDSKKKLETANSKIDKVKEEELEKKLEVVCECLVKAFGSEDEAPFVEVTETALS